MDTYTLYCTMDCDLCKQAQDIGGKVSQVFVAPSPDAPCDIAIGDDDWPGAHYCRTHRTIHAPATGNPEAVIQPIDRAALDEWCGEIDVHPAHTGVRIGGAVPSTCPGVHDRNADG